jgi:hypothetical protein
MESGIELSLSYSRTSKICPIRSAFARRALGE